MNGKEVRVILTPVLVLNASYEPIAVCLARRALTMIAKGVARIEEAHDIFVHRELRLPSVIRLRDYRRVPVRRHTVSRRNIFVRDRHTCQYCKQCFPGLRLTLDHVIPKSRGGLSIWENLVTSCRECNAKKANRTPAEAGMPLAVVPRAMSLHSARHVLRRMGEEDPKWRTYLYF
jgi:5-methylcytosine-specific restriction endonuclease McrA